MSSPKFKNLLRRVGDAVLGESLWDAIRHIAGGLTTGGLFGLFGEKLSTAFSFLTPIKIPIIIFLFLFGIGIITNYLVKRSKYRPCFPRFDFDFEILEREVTLEYNDKTSIIYKRRFKLKALKNKLDTYSAYSDDSGHPFRTKAATYRSEATLGSHCVP